MAMELENIGDSDDLMEKAAILLCSKPHLFEEKLRSLIKYGEEKCHLCIKMIQLLVKEKKQNVLLDIKDDQSVLHLAATFHDCHELPSEIVSCCPQLAKVQRTGLFQGQTFLHTFAFKGNSLALFDFLDTILITEERNKFVQALATGQRFVNTPLMGETLLSVAAVRSDRAMFLTLLRDYNASFADQNSNGDTVLHSLIRYAHAYPNQLQSVLNTLRCCYEDMMEKPEKGGTDITMKKPEEGGTNWGKMYARTVWFTENNAQQTPLQLAVHLGEYEIFEWIMNLQWVYRMLHDCDSLFDINKYDITEVDTLAKLKWIKYKEQNTDSDTSMLKQRHHLSGLKGYFGYEDAFLMRQSSPAILETVCELEVNTACKFISSTVICSLIQSKWKAYRRSIIAWAMVHLLSVVLLTVYAHFKVQYIDSLISTVTVLAANVTMTSRNRTGLSTMTSIHPITRPHEEFVKTSCYILLVAAIGFLYLECVRTFIQYKPWHLLNIYHNGNYRLILFILGLSLLVDSIWFLVSPETNHKLPIILAVLLSWWFTTFFLRPFKLFSFFTVMLQKVLLGDMLRFSAFILLELISFTVAMRLLLPSNQRIPDEFRDFTTSLLTMFRLMLGLTDLEVLEMASPHWLAVLLFVIFVMITCVLLLNSLIAMMSSTCSEIAQAKDRVWQIQRLSVILFMEQTFMMFGCTRPIGKRNYVRKYMKEQEQRYFLEVSTGLTSTVDCTAIARARHYIREDKFDDDDVRNWTLFSIQKRSTVYPSTNSTQALVPRRGPFRQAYVTG